MARADNINVILQKAEKQIEHIEKEYNNSLHDKEIKPELKVDIKNYFENLRSVLDYLANEIRESSYVNNTVSKIFYFPILPNLTDFESRMDQWFPQLKQNNKALYDYLLSLQPFQGADQVWIQQFNKVNNENKHGDLVEQAREEHERVHVTNNQGDELSWDPKSVKFGSRVATFGAPIDPNTQMPIPSPSIQVKRILWVDFQFAGLNVSALALMKKALKEIKMINEQIYSKI